MPNQCDLCSLPVRSNDFPAEYNGGQTYHFCCAGCRMVFAMLMEMADAPEPARFKESELYHRCVAAGVVPASEQDLKQKVGFAAVQTTIADAADEHTLPAENRIDGMWCPACAWVIEAAIMRLNGIASVRCDFSTDRLRYRFHPTSVSPKEVEQVVEQLGYQIGSDDAADAARTLRRDFVRLAVSVLLSVNVMMLSWALYTGFFTSLSPSDVGYISWPIFIMATAVFIYGGGPLLRKAWSGLRHLAPGMETLIMLGAGSAYVYSVFNWWSASLHLYFDTATMLISLTLLGKLLESMAKSRVRHDLEGFLNLKPKKVRLCNQDYPKGRYVAAEQLGAGDNFKVESGEVVPADGRVLHGIGRVDASAITGEPKPVVLMAGDSVVSGSRMINGQLTIKADQVGEQSMLGQLIAIVTHSLSQKSNVEGRTDRLLVWFVPVIATLALATGLIVYGLGGTADAAFIRAVTVLVIACPCAMGIAIPLARVAGVSGAGRLGILVKDPQAFEKAKLIKSVVLDKTGTVTRAQWTVEGIETAPGFDEKRAIALSMGLETCIDHTIARSLFALGDQMGITPEAVEGRQSYPEGISGKIDGSTIRLGTRQFAAQAHNDENACPRPTVLTPDDTALSEVVLSADGAPKAVFYFGDMLRDDMPYTVQKFFNRRLDVHLVSGDDEQATMATARSIGIEKAIGRLSPQDKADYVQKLQVTGRPVAMIGDGINDAPAMARADLSAAIHSGSPLAQHAAHVVLMRSAPLQLIDFLNWAILVDRKIKQNLWCSVIYNAISIPVAMAGLLSPLVAVTAMLLSSLTVIGNTLLLVKQGKPTNDFSQRIRILK